MIQVGCHVINCLIYILCSASGDSIKAGHQGSVAWELLAYKSGPGCNEVANFINQYALIVTFHT